MEEKLEIFQRQKQMLQSLRAQEADEKHGVVCLVFNSFGKYGP